MNMHILKYILRFVLPLLLLVGCAAGRKATNELHWAERIMFEYPDSAKMILERIDQDKLPGAESKATYRLLYSQALDKNFEDVNEDTLIRPALDYFVKHGPDLRIAMSYYYLGRVQVNAGKEKEAVATFFSAEEFAARSGDDFLLGLIYCQIGELYEQQNMFRGSMRYFRLARERYLAAGQTDYADKMLPAIATQYTLIGSVDTATMYFDFALDRALIKKDTLGAINIFQCMSGMHLHFGDTLGARKVLYEMKHFAGIANISTSYHMMLAALFTEEQKLDSAKYYYRLILDESPDDIELQMIVYGAYASIFESKQDYKRALQYSKQYNELADSLMMMNHRNYILEIERKYDNEKLAYENFTLQTRTRFQLIFLLLAVIAMVYLIWRYRKNLHIRELRIQEYKGMVEHLNLTHSNLLTQLDERKEKELRLKKMLEHRFEVPRQFADLVYQYEQNPSLLNKKFRDMLKMNSLNNEAFRDLKEIVNENYNNIVDKLRKIHPNLTEQDLDMCCLICSGFNSQEMCIIFGYTSVNNVYIRKSRLKQKMKDGKSFTDIESYLDSLIQRSL